MKNNKPQEKSKTPTEKETREKLLTAAKLGGFEDDVVKLFARYDDYLKGCISKEEREAMAVMAIRELNMIFNMHPNFAFKDVYGINQHMTINGKIIKE